jgi:hypothetical protein
VFLARILAAVHYRLALPSSVLDGGDEEQPKGGYKLPKPNYQASIRGHRNIVFYDS